MDTSVGEGMRVVCRASGKTLTPVIDLGNLYVSGFYKSVMTEAPRGPLKLGIGEESGLLQLMHTVDPDTVYREYWYRSGTNATMTRQLKEIVEDVPYWVRLKDKDIVLDIGCNDGTLLSHYPKEPKIVKVGIDPARNMAQFGSAHCDVHAADYFTKNVFLGLTQGKKAKVITSIAMFYDLEDPGAFVQDIYDSLTDDGIWIAQISYTPLMVEQNAFDNIVHEHLEFYTLQSIQYLLKKYGFKIMDVQLNDANAGSFRLIMTKESNPVNEAALFHKDLGKFRYRSLLEYESKLDLSNPRVYHEFMRRIEKQKVAMLDLLKKLKKEGKKVYGYGASTKGNTLLQYYGITPDLVTAIAERQPKKYGLFTAGSWIPIVSEDEMRRQKPDYLLVLAWHFIHEFTYREKEFLDRGGKFIMPLPEVGIVGR